MSAYSMAEHSLKTQEDPEPNPHEYEYVNVLMVEDDRADAFLAKRALEASCVPFRLGTLKRAEELISVLERMLQASKTSAHCMPDLLLLDLGLPGMDGFDLLDELARMSPAIRAIPIVVLTGHSDFEYIKDTSSLYIHAYLTKPCSPKDMRDILLSIRRNFNRSNEIH